MDATLLMRMPVKKAQVERDQEGFPTGGIKPTTTVEEAEKIIEQAAAPQDRVVIDEAGLDAGREKPTDRQQQVKDSVNSLVDTIDKLSVSIYQMKLTTPQIQELAKKIVNQVSDTVSEITIQRVQDLTPDVLGAEEP